MRIVHISDLHITNNADHQRTVDALCRDLSSISHNKKIDLVLCSGDIANRGDTSSAAVDSQEKVIRTIIESAGAEVQFLCCPGNHDINLKAREDVYESVFNSIESSEGANKLVENLINKGNDSIWGHLVGYVTLARKLDSSAYKENILFTTKVVDVNGLQVGIASLNSSWRTTGGGDKDRNKLYVGERQVELALKNIQSCDIKIALMHHTLDWLAPEEKNKIQRLLATNFDALLCGHNHNNNAGHTTSTLGNLLISNTGCIYEHREHFNGYSVIDVQYEDNRWKIEAREYYSQRNEFDISPRFAKDGVCEFNIVQSGNSSKSVISSTAINAALDRANSKLLSFSASDVAPKHISSIFVEPPLARISEKNLAASEGMDKGGTDQFVSLHSLSQEKVDVLFIGKRESGKSTLLNHIAVNCFMEFHGSARVGFLIDISLLNKLTVASILSQAIEFIGNEITKKELINILVGGEALVIFDGFNIHSPNHRKLVNEFCEEYPAPRYILATSEEVQDDLTIEQLPALNKKATPIYIHSFKSRQTKELVRKWFGEHDQGAEEKLTLVKKLLSRLNVPQTPFLVSILLWVIEQQPSAKLINQASAVEALVTGLLEKFTESRSRSSYDSNIQAHFLSELSTSMDNLGSEWVGSNEFEVFVTTYFSKRGLAVPSRGFTEELLRKGLLYENNNRIAFKFDCFRAFFLAKRLAENSDALAAVLTPANISKYSSELDLLTGLHRARKEILLSARASCKELLGTSGFDVDIKLFEEQGVEKGLFNREETLTRIEDDFINSPTDDDNRARMIEKVESPSKASIDHDHARQRHPISPSASSSTLMQFVSALKTYSNILRNSELIDDVELKRACLHDVLGLWSKVIVATTTQMRKVKLSDLPDEISTQFGTLNPAEFKDLANLIIPQVFSSLMTESLATPKLESFVLGETNNSSHCIRFLSTMLAIENLNKHSLQAVKKLLKDLGSNNIVTQAVFIRLLTLYYFEAPASSLGQLRDCIGDAFTALRGASNNEKSVLKGRFLQHLDEKRTNTLNEFDA